VTDTTTSRGDDTASLLRVLEAQEEHARHLDAVDQLPTRREEFHVPPAEGGEHAETAYLAGNSLGLRPRRTSVELLEDMEDWARWGVEGHTEARRPWLPYHALLREPMARLVGARPEEVVAMNSLTVNLHLLLVSFYRPAGVRRAILIEDSTFPSDSYAVRSQVAFHGYQPDRSSRGCGRGLMRTCCAPRTSSTSSAATGTSTPSSCSAGSTT